MEQAGIITKEAARTRRMQMAQKAIPALKKTFLSERVIFSAYP
jgi:hypothetical protein